MAKIKLTVQDVPRLLKALSCGDAKTQQATLTQLCPCRNKVYDREIWMEIFRTYDAAGVAGRRFHHHGRRRGGEDHDFRWERLDWQLHR